MIVHLRLHHNLGRLVLRVALVTTFFGIYIANQSLVYQASLAVWLSPVCAGIGLIIAADMTLSIYKAGLDAQKQQQELKEKKDGPDPVVTKKDDGPPMPTTSSPVSPSFNQPKQHPNLLRRIFQMPKGRFSRVSHDSSHDPLPSPNAPSMPQITPSNVNMIRQASSGKESPRRSPTLDNGEEVPNYINNEDSRITKAEIVVEASKMARASAGSGQTPLRGSASGALGESSRPDSGLGPYDGPGYNDKASMPPIKSPMGLGKSTLPPIKR